jgi:exodeoxyribonuclease V alpha subunit
MQIKNNYQLEWEQRTDKGFLVDSGSGIFNGDMGIITKINNLTNYIEVKFDDDRYVTYDSKQAEELELAYAVTIHKSQGSEYPAVVMPLVSGASMLMTRNLLYTGVTRAKKCVHSRQKRNF